MTEIEDVLSFASFFDLKIGTFIPYNSQILITSLLSVLTNILLINLDFFAELIVYLIKGELPSSKKIEDKHFETPPPSRNNCKNIH